MKYLRCRAFCALVPLIVLLVATALALTATASATEPSPLRIINGAEATDANWTARWTSMVGLVNSTASSEYVGQFCAGTLIDMRLVATAAHCVFDRLNGGMIETMAPSELRVFPGDRRLADSYPSEGIPVIAIFVHPSYDPMYSAYEVSRNDVAVLRLGWAAPVPAAPVLAVQAAETALWGNGAGLPQGAATGPWIAGWGNVDLFNASFPNELREANVPLVSDAACAANINDVFASPFDNATMACGSILDTDGTGNQTTNGVDTCQGDSGGPLIVSDGIGGPWRLAGITSWGFGCAEEQYGVYTRVDAFRAWIESVNNATDGPMGIQDPTGLMVTATAYRTANLDWLPPVGGATDYQVYRIESGGYLLHIITKAIDEAVATGLSPNKRYRLFVRSRDGAGNWSPGISVIVQTLKDITRPIRPSSISAGSRGRHFLTVKWGAGSDDDIPPGYEVWMARCASGCAFKRVKYRISSKRVWTQTGLAAHTRYRFKIRTRDASGNQSIDYRGPIFMKTRP